MKQIIISLTLLLSASIFVAVDSLHKRKTYMVDSDKSQVIWLGKKVTGEHTGTIGIKSGEIKTHDGLVESAMITIDMTTITCTDLQDEAYNQKLVGHLSSDDFFSVATHPESTFKLTSIRPGSDGVQHTISGDLTIKGITHPVSFIGEVSELDKNTIRVSGTMTFDRTKWNIKYGSGQFFDALGDKMIYDDVEMTFNIVAKSA